MNLPFVVRYQAIWTCITFCYVFLWGDFTPSAHANVPVDLVQRFAPILVHDSYELSPLTSVASQQALGWKKHSTHIDFGRKISKEDPVAYYATVTTPRYIYLQYWFFYSWNDTSHFGVLQRCTQHEGDWEHIALRLDRHANDSPSDLYYASHKRSFLSEKKYLKPEQVNWRGQQPLVYVARGSHASYAMPGKTVLFSLLGIPLVDINDGGGKMINLRHRIYPLKMQPWFGFAGRWGAFQNGPCQLLEALTPASNDGPTGPGFGDKIDTLRYGDWYDVKRKP